MARRQGREELILAVPPLTIRGKAADTGETPDDAPCLDFAVAISGTFAGCFGAASVERVDTADARPPPFRSVLRGLPFEPVADGRALRPCALERDCRRPRSRRARSHPDWQRAHAGLPVRSQARRGRRDHQVSRDGARASDHAASNAPTLKGRTAMSSSGRLLIASLIGVAVISIASIAAGEEAYLSGGAASASGEKMAGVSVSAKAEGQTITTSVYTDAAGKYYFPALAPGKYRVWAQADGYATARDEIDLSKTRHQDFTLKPTDDFESQLTGDQVLAALPEDTPDDRRLKRIVHNNCSGCHTPSYILQRRFDEAGWTAVIELMKRVNVGGIYQGADAKPNAILDFHEKELAAYLARARGPGPTSMKFKLRPRPSGETARVVFKEYDVPHDPALKLPDQYPAADGSDWSLGTPSGIDGGHIVHDAWPDLNGNLWFTNNTPSPDISIGRVDAQTGAVKFFKIAALNGMAANSHGMTRDSKGNLWFNVGPTLIPNHGGLARLAPRTEKIDVF